MSDPKTIPDALGSPSARALDDLLGRASSRLRLRRGILALTPGALAGGVVALLVLAGAKTSFLPDWAAYTSPFAVAFGAGISFLLAWGRRTSNEEMAQLVDLHFGLAERITTGWEIARRGARTPIEERAVELAVESARHADSRDAVPVRAPKSAPVGLASFLIPVLLAMLLPAWVPPFLERQREEEAQVKSAGEALEKEAEAMKEPDAPTPTPGKGSGPEEAPTPAPGAKPDETDSAAKLKKLAEKMKSGDVSKRDAMKELAELDEEIAREQAKNARAEAARALARAADRLEEKERSKGLGQALSEGEAEQIRKEKKDLARQFDEGEFETREQRSMSEDLDALADALEAGGDPAAAAELREAAEDLRKGDRKGAKEHLEKADLAAATQGAREADPVFEMAKELKKNQDTRAAGKAIDRGSMEKTAESLEELAEKLENGKLGAEKEKDLQQTLEKASKAGTSQGENSPGGQMSKPLESAAKSLERGNRDGAAEALRNLSRGMARGARQARQNGEARSAVARARARLGGQRGAVQPMQWGDQGPGGQDGKGQDGKGEAGKGTPKDGKHVADAPGNPGTEAGSGTSRFQDNAFEAGEGPQFDRQSDRQSDWRKEYEQAYKAARTDAAELGDTRITGKMGPGESQHIEIEGKPEKGEAREGYVDLPASYRDAAEEAVGNEDIPPEHRDRVKSYFEALSGSGEKP